MTTPLIQANPYAPPKANLAASLTANPGNEQIRNQHLKHEASLQSVGSLYYLSSFFTLLPGIGMLLMSLLSGEFNAFAIGFSLVYVAMGVGFLALGRGLRNLASWVKVPVGLLAGIGLLALPIGTLINGYILYLLFSQKGTMVLSEEYAAVRASTPHIKYRTPWWMIGLLVLIVVGIAAMIAAMIH